MQVIANWKWFAEYWNKIFPFFVLIYLHVHRVMGDFLSPCSKECKLEVITLRPTPLCRQAMFHSPLPSQLNRLPTPHSRLAIHHSRLATHPSNLGRCASTHTQPSVLGQFSYLFHKISCMLFSLDNGRKFVELEIDCNFYVYSISVFIFCAWKV